MSKSRALANQEREMQVRRLSYLAKATLLTAATLLTFATAGLLIADHLYRPDAFVIDQLKMKGKFKYLAPEEVQAVIYQKPIGNFFSVELNEIKQRVEAMAWVQHADVRREWPHTLTVSIREHRPIMRWKTVGDERIAGEQWVSSTGEVITLDKPLEKDSPIALSGAEHDARMLLSHAVRWRKQLKPSGVDLSEVGLSASQAWTLLLAYPETGQKFNLLLGRENIEDRLNRFQMLFDKQLKRANQLLVRVDARYPDGLAVEAQEIETAHPEKVVGTNLKTNIATRG